MASPSRVATPPPASSSSSNNHSTAAPAFSGWLEKQAEWKFTWNRRFVELCGTIISYREEGATSDKKCAEVRCLQKTCAGSPPHTFRVWTDRGGCWVLRCANGEEHTQWTTAIADSLHETHPEEELSCEVEKCSAWTKQWRSRYVTLSGLKLSYAETRGGATKNRYVVSSADACLNDTEIRVAVSTGEWFVLRFPDATLARLWLSTIRRTQRRVHTLRWQSLTPTSDGSTFCGAVGHSAASFEGKHILLFGGSLPNPKHDGNQLQRELIMTSLVGEHPASIMHPLPFEELSNHTKLCPPPREFGAVTLLSNGAFVMYGGIAGRPLEVLQDGWMTNVAICGPWGRFQPSPRAAGDDMPSATTSLTQLPPLFGHSMHALVPSVMSALTTTTSSASHVSSPPSSSLLDTNAFLVVGGVDSKFTAQSDVFQCTVVHPSDTSSPSTATKFHVVRRPRLDRPRGMHTGVDLGGGGVVLVGGTHGRYSGLDIAATASSCDDDAHKTVSVLTYHDDSAESMQWKSVTLSPPLPPNTLRPGACAHGAVIYVWCSDLHNAPALHSILLTPELAVVTALSTRGEVPSITRGVSLHMSEDYCYLFGGGGRSTSTSGTIHRVLPPLNGTEDTQQQEKQQLRPSSAEERL
ncbi:Hypothetical protein, putative [Bodo saltans]|uniref:PH domain-containing protein n=1 Tax=Bodo saltans TaxID=75058 RepID=A0A0S4JAS3_BODSA|nr:Hypothetical protein, putative [Bodo saltans]|eukprot:CUG87250.1 Hypothetical protein, putative [Bodo saltans]